MPLVQAGSAVTAALLDALGVQGVIKPTDQSLTSNTTLQDDSALTLPVLAAATYFFICYLNYEGANGAGFLKWTWSVPSGAAMRYHIVRQGTGGGADSGLTLTDSTTTDADTLGAGNLQGLTMLGTLVMSSTAGDIQLEWAQNASNATPTIVHAQSFLGLWRVT